MARGTQFTCFTGTKVQILTREEVQVSASGHARHDVYKPDQTRPIAGAHSLYSLYSYTSTCFTGTKVQTLALRSRRCGGTQLIFVLEYAQASMHASLAAQLACL
jgi:hypothetical protein